MSGAIEIAGFETEDLAAAISEMYVSGTAAKQQWHNRVKETIQYVYATSTKDTVNSDNGWSHSTHIPKLTQIHDNLGANYSSALFGRKDFFTFDPGNEEAATKEKNRAVTSYLSTKHDSNNFIGVMKRLLNDWVQTGNCFCQVDYVVKKTKDPRTGLEIVQYEGPEVLRISPYDIVFDAQAESFKSTPKIFKRLMGRGDFARYVLEHESAQYDMIAVAKVINYSGMMGSFSDAEINKQQQIQMDGFQTYAQYIRSGKVELLQLVGDIWDPVSKTLQKDRLITIADRKFVVRNQAQDDIQGFGKIYHCGWRVRPDNLWAMGPLDNLVGMQYLINHLENARADGFDQILAPDRVHVGNVQIEQDGPVTNYYIDDGNGSVNNLAPDVSFLQADFQIQVKEAQMEAYAGAPKEAMGIRTAGEKTAFEVQQLNNAAARLFQTKIEEFEREFVEEVLNGELEVAVKNLSTVDVVKVVDDDDGVIEFLDITVEDLSSRGKIKARGASHYSKRAQRVQELTSLNNILAGDPELKVHFPAKKRAEAMNNALGFDNLELFVPFGGVDEAIELQEAQKAAMDASANTEAVEVPPNI